MMNVVLMKMSSFARKNRKNSVNLPTLGRKSDGENKGKKK